MIHSLWDLFFVPVGLEPQVRVWGARGALPVAGLSYIRLRRVILAVPVIFLLRKLYCPSGSFDGEYNITAA